MCFKKKATKFWVCFSHCAVCAVLSCFSCVWLSATLWTVVAWQAPLSMGFSRQEYWSGLPCPSPGDLPDQGSKPCLISPALVGGFFTTELPGKPNKIEVKYTYGKVRAYVFSRFSHIQLLWLYGPRDATCLFCIAGWFFTTEPAGLPIKTITDMENKNWT